MNVIGFKKILLIIFNIYLKGKNIIFTNFKIIILKIEIIFTFKEIKYLLIVSRYIINLGYSEKNIDSKNGSFLGKIFK